MTLVEFLRARLDEDEERLDAIDHPQAPAGNMARERREVEAKRRIVDEHPRGTVYAFIREGPYCLADDEVFPCATLRALAEVYADHPEYDESWRP